MSTLNKKIIAGETYTHTHTHTYIYIRIEMDLSVVSLQISSPNKGRKSELDRKYTIMRRLVCEKIDKWRNI